MSTQHHAPASETLSAQANARAMVSRRKFVGSTAALGAGLSAFLLAGCNTKQAPAPTSESGSAAGAPVAKDTLKIYVGNEPEAGFDPLLASHSVASLTSQYLFTFDAQGNIIGDLAESYDVNDAGTEYTLHIKKGIMFNDGSAMTAKDVAYSLQTLKDSKESEIDLTSVSSISAPNDETVVVKLSKPFAPLVFELGHCAVVPQGKYDAKTFASNPIATGAFKIQQWDKGQQVILVPNEHYYKDKSPFKQITLLFIDQDTAIAQAIAGELDLIYVLPQLTAQADKIKGYSLQGFPTLDVRGFDMPIHAPQTKKDEDGKDRVVGHEILSDPAVRKALTIGLDRQWIIDNAWNGRGKPCTNYSVGQPWTNPKGDIKDGRVEDAAKLLEEAGWVMGSDGVRVKDGQRCSFMVYGQAEDIERYYLAQAMAENAKKLGIEIIAEVKPWSECWDNRGHIPTCWGFGNYTPYVQFQLIHSGAVYNFAEYANEHTDKLIDESFAQTDHGKMSELLKKAIWDDSAKMGPGSEEGDAPFLWLANFEHTFFVREGLDLGPQIRHPHGHGWPIVQTLANWRFKA